MNPNGGKSCCRGWFAEMTKVIVPQGVRHSSAGGLGLAERGTGYVLAKDRDGTATAKGDLSAAACLQRSVDPASHAKPLHCSASLAGRTIGAALPRRLESDLERGRSFCGSRHEPLKGDVKLLRFIGEVNL